MSASNGSSPMMTLADATALLDKTTDQLSGDLTKLTPRMGIQLVEQWIQALQTGENTKPMADKLVEIRHLLETGEIDGRQMSDTLGELADMLSELSPQMGSEGEMPSLLDGLATALRQAGGTSKAG